MATRKKNAVETPVEKAVPVVRPYPSLVVSYWWEKGGEFGVAVSQITDMPSVRTAQDYVRVQAALAQLKEPDTKIAIISIIPLEG